MLPGASEWLSMGDHTMHAGFHFLWIGYKYQCFLSPDGRYIIIFEMELNTPIWSPAIENQDQKLLGTFEFWNNCFRERCGIFINKDAQICLDVEFNFRYYNKLESHRSSAYVAKTQDIPATQIEQDLPQDLCDPTQEEHTQMLSDIESEHEDKDVARAENSEGPSDADWIAIEAALSDKEQSNQSDNQAVPPPPELEGGS